MKATNVGVDPDLMEEYLRTVAKSARKRGRNGGGTTRSCRGLGACDCKAHQASAHRLANELLYQRFRLDQDALTRDLSIVVSNAVAKAAGISARTKTNALNELVRLGLIEVVREPRRSPRVTLLRIEVLRR